MPVLKRLAQQVALRSGLTATRGAWLRRQRSPGGSVEIFFGHHVAADGVAGLTGDDLRARVAYLRRTRDLVSLSDAVAWLQHPRTVERLAVLTFDDGYRDNLTRLVPVLREAGAPATIFVATEPVVSGEGLWFDRVRAALRHADVAALARLPLPGADGVSGDPAGMRRRALEHLKRLSPADRPGQVAAVLAALPDAQSDPQSTMLTRDELAALAAEPLVTLGGHTHSHTVVSGCTEQELREELAQSAAVLEDVTGVRPTLFAYPNGCAGDFSEMSARILRESGFAAAVTTLSGLNRPAADLFALKRIPLGDGPVARFAWQIERAAGPAEQASVATT